MNSLLLTGIVVVLFACASYSTAVVTQLKQRRITGVVRVFLTAGVALDATSTGFMIAGSRRIPLTFHGVLGYSAFLLMAADLALSWMHFKRHGCGEMPKSLLNYSLGAYVWWILAFIAGGIVVSRLG
ncbi:MAG: hypothetical protein ABSG38_11240 [Spirochaetia bacterium]|jgi:hypothetical protein